MRWVRGLVGGNFVGLELELNSMTSRCFDRPRHRLHQAVADTHRRVFVPTKRVEYGLGRNGLIILDLSGSRFRDEQRYYVLGASEDSDFR